MSLTDQQNVRDELVRRLRSDLLGPSTPDEVLRQDKETGGGDTPLSRYLMGILYPSDSLVAPEEDDSGNDIGNGEEDDADEGPIQLTGIPKPSSIGLSFAVVGDTKEIQVEFRYGIYTPTDAVPPPAMVGSDESKAESRRRKPVTLWTRTQIVESTTLTLPDLSKGHLDMAGGGRGEGTVKFFV